MKQLKYKMEVEIDGKVQFLTPAFSGNNQWQYNTEGNTSAHLFKVPLPQLIGKTFRTNGHTYKVIREIKY